MTAEELMKKLSDDKTYQERNHLKDLEIKRNHDLLAKEYEQFSNDCKKFGYSLETAWDLIMVEESYSDLIPVLINYLAEKNHSPKFREGIARALAVYDSSPYFNKILELYYESKDEHESVHWAIACALSAAAITQDQLDVIEKLILNKDIGNDRNALLDSIPKMKGEQRIRVVDYAKSDLQLKINLNNIK